MSNRCELYACDADPSLYDVAPRGISEHVADVALLQLIMIARGARAVGSQLFEDRLAVLADSAGAAERALAFIDKLAERDVPEPEDFAEAVKQMRNVLATTSLGRFLLLEVGEVFDTDEAITELIGSLAEVDAKIDRALSGHEEAWLEELRQSWQDIVMPWWASSLYYTFDQPSVRWSRRDVEAMLLAHDAAMTKRVGHPFKYRLAPSVETYQLRAVIGVLPSLARDVETTADARVWSCEISVHDGQKVAVSFRDTTLFIAFGPRGWPNEGPRRRIMDALGMPPPPMRFEYGRGTV
jgi:hypothetical protein